MPRLKSGSVADLVFGVDVYNNIVSCLYSSEDIRVHPQDPQVSGWGKKVGKGVTIFHLKGPFRWTPPREFPFNLKTQHRNVLA